jgi:hypothetical protein
MYQHARKLLPDIAADPFGEQMAARRCSERMLLLGGRFRFESDSRALLRLTESAYAGLPGHRLSASPPAFDVKLVEMRPRAGPRARDQPAPLGMLSGGALLGAASGSSSVVLVSPAERQALITVAPDMLESAYHTRYEMMEFAVFTLAARAQSLVPLHAACVGRRGRGILIMGPSGAGKSTLAMQCLLEGLDFLAEDSVFIEPYGLRATGVPNYLHLRADSLRWVESAREAAALKRSPVIRRRSGVKKYEIDLRNPRFRLAKTPLRVDALVFLSSRRAGDDALLAPLPHAEAARRLAAEQAYAAGQGPWRPFLGAIRRIPAFEMRRGSHPRAGVRALGLLLEKSACA